LELGAGSSDLENVVKKNFKRDDIKFTKVDGDKRYESESDKTITVFDITSEEFNNFCKKQRPFDAIVFMEVIEHLDKNFAATMFERIASWLVSEGMLLFTTPTPPYEGMYEDRVWPIDHKEEFTNSEIYGIINKEFKINKEIGWSLEEREYNKLLETDANLSMIASKLRGAFPESYIRAIIACLSPTQANRQVLMICKKRRIANGRFT
jgi:2-polyprenyl-3-methyl-5-hydroxy-6-metoxy-1,4-benzoquinol methylase